MSNSTPQPGAARIPEPALVRSFLITVTGIIAFAVGHNVDTAWVDSATTVYGLIAPLIAGVLIRRAVSPKDQASAP
ncbi:hypothetical protein GFY24_00650 [Nocardia sp. SYP-A9097]|uniref:hypothetical protein n=1 Tax=Nocardia sp. SYP-A9097 TaxID=2663237 RepID=UPI00129A20A0|nr:hypothetical protein [Nocardia sp. SYP-A9097]MRH85986.1 hypothetical protein [Nocardia sp. SYP-A9097]